MSDDDRSNKSVELDRKLSDFSNEKIDESKPDADQHDQQTDCEAQISSEEPPYHVFSLNTKRLLVLIVSFVGTLSGLSSNIYFPAQTELAKGLNITNETVNLSITTYMIAQGLSPSFWAPIADYHGRRTTLIMTIMLYVGANIALALVVDGPMLLIFRALQAAGSASTIALGAGVIADLFPSSDRGLYMGWFSGVRQFSLAFGPVLGGALAGGLGWRSIFWFLVIFSAFTLVLIVLIVPETLRSIAGNGSIKLLSWKYYAPLWSLLQRSNSASQSGPSTTNQPARRLDWRKFVAPLGLMFEPDVFCALLFGGCVYTAWSMMVASTTYSLQSVYQFNTIQIGFAFLANGIGCVAGSITAGQSLNSDFRREINLWQHAQDVKINTPFPSKILPTSFPIEYARLSKGPVYSIVTIWSLSLFGWSLTAPGPTDDPKSHWITPLLAQAAAGWSATSVLTSNSALVVDLFPGQSASVSAVMNMSRCLLGAAGVAGVEPFLRNFGPGWTSVLLVGIVVVGLIPYTLHATYGARWREARELKIRQMQSQG